MSIKYSTREEFDDFFHREYQPITYADVKDQFLEHCASNTLFVSDYPAAGQNASRKDFTEHFNQNTLFHFQDIYAEAFYEKNATLYEAAFSIFEENGGTSSEITKTYEQAYEDNYREILDQFYADYIAKMLDKS